MAPYPHSQIVPRDAASDGIGGSSSNGIPPLFIVGFAFAGTIIIGLCAWLGVYTYKKRKRSKGDALTIQGVISESNEKDIRPRHVPSCTPAFLLSRLTVNALPR